MVGQGVWPGLVASLLVLTLTFAPATARAASTGACSDYGYNNRLYGYLTDSWSGHRWGMRGRLDSQTLYQCTSPRAGEGSASTVWLAVQGPEGAYAANIVQIGLGVCRSPSIACPSYTSDFYAWGVDPTTPGCSGWALVPPTPHFLSTNSGGYEYTVSYHDGAYHLTTGFGAHVDVGSAQICWTPPTTTAGVAETWDYGDQMGGTSTDPFVMSAIQFQTSINGSWINLPTSCNHKNPTTLESIFHCYVPGSSQLAWYTYR